MPVQVNNIDANILQTSGGTGQDNFTICFTPNNTIWLVFQSNATGGPAQVNFSNPVFEVNPGQDSEMQATIVQAGSPCDGSSYSAVAGACNTNATGNFTLNANLAPNTTYYLILNGARNGVGITAAAEFTVDVNLSGPGADRPLPTITIQSDTVFCQDQVATFTASLGNCPDSSSYQWFINGVLTAITPDSIFQTTALQHGDVVSVSNSCYANCPVTPTAASPAMTIISFPVDAGPDAHIEPGQSVTLQGSTNAFTYFWTPLTAISNPSILTPTVSPEVTTSYFLTGEINGCQISDEVVVTVDFELQITNTFTPNDDGNNDTWEIPGLIHYPNCLVQIYDRWGQQVFSTTGYNDKKSWDGKRKGNRLTEGSYFYTIDLRDGTDRLLKGSVTIIR